MLPFFARWVDLCDLCAIYARDICRELGAAYVAILRFWAIFVRLTATLVRLNSASAI